jgi:hypothetical protein
MAKVSTDGDHLVVEVEGLDKLWSLKSRLVIPLANIRGATVDPGIIKEPKGLRMPGTHVPGVITAGSFRTDGEWVFWDVRDPAKAVVIELSNEEYTRLVVQVPDPRDTVALIENATRKG